MRAVVFDGFGGPEVLALRELPRPRPGSQELLVRVRAAALNRADTLQRAGVYAPPPGQIEIPGVEIAGEVAGWGPEVTGFREGDPVFGITAGGGYAEYCLLDQGMAVPVPERWSWTVAAAVPEVFVTADVTLFEMGGLRPGETALVHAAGSGVGTACIQLARQAGARVLATCSAGKLARAEALGAEAIDHGAGDFATEVLARTGGEGVDVIEDCVGAAYLKRNLAVLKPGGRLVEIGLLSGWVTEIDLETVVLKRLQIKGSAFRPRPLAEKRAVTRRFRDTWLPMLVDGRLVAVVDSVFPLEQAADAHRRMDANLNFGKILLEIA